MELILRVDTGIKGSVFGAPALVTKMDIYR